MGAETNVTLTDLPATASEKQIKDKYTELRDAASWRSGHGGYTGTIAEAQGCKIALNKKFDTVDAAYEAIDDFAEKWGPAVAILVKNGTDYVVAFAGIYSC